MMKYYIIAFALLSLVSICDTTLLWRINVNPPAYLLGTAHLPFTYLWPSISNTAKSAFYNSTHFLPEFDMTNFFSFARFRMCMDPHMLINANVPPPLPPLSKFIDQHEQEPTILDIYLMLEARRLRKNIASLESVDMYCEFTKFQISSLITNITSNGDKIPPPMKDDYQGVKLAYNCDLNFPGELFPPVPTSTEDKKLLAFKQSLEEIVGRRDTSMAQTINNSLKGASSNDRYFFAVGFIHLMGSNGIIEKLRRDYKYSITRLCTDSQEFRTTLRCQGPSWCDPRPGL